MNNRFKYSLARFRTSSHDLEIEKGRYNRTSSHDLEIEKGRYNRIRREDRLCKLCNLHQIETEYHFYLLVHFVKT